MRDGAVELRAETVARGDSRNFRGGEPASRQFAAHQTAQLAFRPVCGADLSAVSPDAGVIQIAERAPRDRRKNNQRIRMNHLTRVAEKAVQHGQTEMRNYIVRENQIVNPAVRERRPFGFDQVDFGMIPVECREHQGTEIDAAVRSRRETQEVEQAAISAANFQHANRFAFSAEKPQLLRNGATKCGTAAAALRIRLVCPESAK